MSMLFADRVEAGRSLAARLVTRGYRRPFVLGVPRGGIVVAYEVAKELACPLDVVITQKIGAPGQEELAIGAVDRDGEVMLDKAVVSSLRVPQEYIDQAVVSRKAEVVRREKLFRGERSLPVISGRSVIIVDDGIATGATMEAAIAWVKRQGAKRVVVAVPVASLDAVERLTPVVDELVVLHTPPSFYAVGQFYQDFTQVSDEEVTRVLGEYGI